MTITSKTKKKVGIIVGSVVGVLLLFMITGPFVFEKQIKQAVVDQANKHLNAKVGFSDVHLNFFSHFPNVSIGLDSAYVAGINKFKGDTLCSVAEADLVIDVISLFSSDGYKVKKLEFDNPIVFAHVLPDGSENWDIIKPTKEKKDKNEKPFKMSLKQLSIDDGQLTYFNEQSNVRISADSLYYDLSGNMTENSTNLTIATTMQNLFVRVNDVPYLNGVNVDVEVDLFADMKRKLFTIGDNETHVNDVKFSLDGWFRVLKPSGVKMDLKLKAPDTQFKDILSLIPAIYSKSFEDIQTKGSVRLTAYAKGWLIANQYPAFGINLNVSKAWFKYPSLPRSVDNIFITASVSNPGGSMDNTSINVSRFSFVMAGNPFSGNLRLATLASDPDFDINAKGRINLGMIKEVYPIDNSAALSGVADLNLKLKGKSSYYKAARYDKIYFLGRLNLSNMLLLLNKKNVQIRQANFVFNPRYVDMSALNMNIGRNDVTAKGHLENFIPYLFNNETLKGNLTTQSNNLNLNDFVTSGDQQSARGEKKKSERAVVELPNNLDFELTSDIKQFNYNAIRITNARGNLHLKDSKLNINHLALSGMGGSLNLDGVYDAHDLTAPRLNLNVKLNNVVFSEVCKEVETVKKLVPIFADIDGRFSSDLKFSSILGDDMIPLVNSVVSSGTITSRDLNLRNVKVFHKIASTLNRDEFKDPEISSVTIPFEIKNGKLQTKQFGFNIADTKFMVDDGQASIDQTLDYTMHVDQPASQTTLFKLSKLNIKIGGTFSNPTVKISTKDVVKDAVSTISTATKQKVSDIKVVAKQQVGEMKSQMKDQMQEAKQNMSSSLRESKKEISSNFKEAGQNIKSGFKNMFHKNKESDQ